MSYSDAFFRSSKGWCFNKIYILVSLQVLTSIISVFRTGSGSRGQEGLPGAPSAENVPNVAVDNSQESKSRGVQKPDKIRSLFPEAWLWDIVDIGFVST